MAGPWGLPGKLVRRAADRSLDLLPDPALAGLARAAFTPRPIAPYPGWFYGSFRANRSPGARRRLAMWRAANRRGADRPVVLDWHGIRLRAYLGNGMTLPLFVDGAIEPNELALVAESLAPGHVFVDAGANEGLFTLLASRRVGSTGRVLAIEPTAPLPAGRPGGLADAALRAQGSSAEELVALLSGHGYGLYAFDERTGRPRPYRAGETTLTLVAAHGRPPWRGSG